MSQEEAEVQEQEVQLTAEDKARAGGWVPKDEWRGDPERWVDADTFVERGENIVPILRERTESLQKKVVELERTLKEFSQHYNQMEQRNYAKAIAQVKREMREAVRVGDEDAFDAAEKKMEVIQNNIPNVQTSRTPTEKDPVFIEWKASNKWFGSDEEMTELAVAIGDTIEKKRPNIELSELLAEVERRMKDAMPNKFQNARQNAPAAVHGGGEKGGVKPQGKGYRDLPPEARQMCDSFVKQGLLTKEQYVKDFFGA